MKTFLILLGLVLFAFCCSGQNAPFDPRVSTMGSCPACSGNGRSWQGFKVHDYKLAFIAGIGEATSFLIGLFNPTYRTYFPQSLSGDELVTAIDRFYEQPENLPIPIMQAMRIVTLRANGEDPTSVDKEIATLRRDAVALQQQLQQNKK